MLNWELLIKAFYHEGIVRKICNALSFGFKKTWIKFKFCLNKSFKFHLFIKSNFLTFR